MVAVSVIKLNKRINIYIVALFFIYITFNEEKIF